MPKQKTHQGVKARFKVTKNQRVLARKSHRNHNLSKENGLPQTNLRCFKNNNW